MAKPKIICLCGSTRFKSTFERLSIELTLKGNIVLTPMFYGQLPGENKNLPTISVKLNDKLKKLHLKRIVLSDKVIIINNANYVGDDTFNEIIFAQKLFKPVVYLNKTKRGIKNAQS